LILKVLLFCIPKLYRLEPDSFVDANPSNLPENIDPRSQIPPPTCDTALIQIERVRATNAGIGAHGDDK
jgi:hypothetical protein